MNTPENEAREALDRADELIEKINEKVHDIEGRDDQLEDAESLGLSLQGPRTTGEPLPGVS